MRKHEQQSILELLDTIKIAQADGLYADCQESAFAIIEYIDAVHGEGTKTVARLEEYYKLLFHVSQGTKNAKSLRAALYEIVASVHAELRQNKLEIIFISHIASMSDSLESIYLAAKTDPACNAYFIPIPYYEMNPDGSTRDVRYEGREFYSNEINITPYQDYDIEARHPDVIFTFNGYDEANVITRVHSDYHCSSLREYTDLLVYVPYFVAPNGISEHFCTLPGCVFSHKVIMENEKIRKIYMDAFSKEFGTQFYKRFGSANNKFVALGNPKYDKLLRRCQEERDMPEGLDELLKGRKTVLWNTSINGILQNNEKYLAKMCDVIGAFDDAEAALWWRPHPLSEATLSSMRPRLLEKYRAISREYKKGAVSL